MDKESLKKNQFWYLLGGFGLVWLILWVCALASGSETAEKNKKDSADKTKSLKDWATKKPKNASFIEPWEKYRQAFAAQKDRVWGTAWDTQSSFYQWPVTSDNDFNKVMRYADETKELPLRQREDFKRAYPTQFKGLEKLVAPAVFNGDDVEAAVGISRPPKTSGMGGEKGSGFDVIMGPTLPNSDGAGAKGGPGERMPQQRGPTGMTGASGDGSFKTILEDKDPPTPEEIWILEEDFWVKREMLNIIHRTQQAVGHFTEVKEKNDEPKPEGVQPDAVVKRYSNGIWEFTFYIEQPKDGARRPVLNAKSTIKNVSPTRSVLPLASGNGLKPLSFVLTQGAEGNIRFALPVSGEPLPYGNTFALGQRAPDILDLLKDFNLEQEFDWSNAPVRRIDALRTAKQSHRTAKSTLKPNPIFPPPPDSPSTTTNTTTPNPAPMPTGGTPMGPNATLGVADAPDVTPCGLDRDRYIMATEQARHLPIAMVLIVEPSHVNDVLVAVANSPLRIQTTQVAFHQIAIKGPPDPNDEVDKAQIGMGPGGDIRRPRPMPMPTTGTATATEEGADANLVELTIYGIATLYERPKKKEEPTPVTPQPTPMPKTPPGKK